MKVVDRERSEVGQQRLMINGRLSHCCCVCGKVDVWRTGWIAYYSLKDLDDAELIPKFCSDECRKTGGQAAKNITQEMLEEARKKEFREPRIYWREATDKEKWAAAVTEQKRRQRTLSPHGEG